MIDVENKKINLINYTIIASVFVFNIIMLSIKNIDFPVYHYTNFIFSSIFLISFIKFLEFFSKKISFNQERASLYIKSSFIFKRVLELILISIVCAITSYLCAMLNFPLYDAVFDKWDKFLGFNWIYWFHIVYNNDWLSLILLYAYNSIIFQFVILILLIGYKGPIEKLQIFIFLLLSTAILTIIISGLMPAFAAYSYYNITPDIIAGKYFAAPYLHIEHLEKLRSGLLTAIPDELQGIITFPSFHASLAVLFIISSHNLPYFKWVFFVLNSVMIVATPIEGGHYLVDVIAGIMITLFMFCITKLPFFLTQQIKTV